MKLGLGLDYAGQRINLPMPLIEKAEASGFDSVWIAEAWGSDTVSVASWILAHTKKIKVGTAIMQIPSRAPTGAAMAAMSLSQLSGGRFIMGIGASGPQVVEGWYGAAYSKPLARTREYIDIMRQVMAREKVQYDGEFYQLPYRGEGATAQGKALKSILEANDDIKIYVASFTPGGLRLAGEIADGVMPVYLSPEKFGLLEKPLLEGFALSDGARGYHNFDVVPQLMVSLGDDLESCRLPVRYMLALYLGGMGSKNKNFYNEYAQRLGYVEESRLIQELYLAGRKDEAAAAVPNELIDEIALVGPRSRIIEQAQKWKSLADSGKLSKILIGTTDAEAIELMAELFL